MPGGIRRRQTLNRPCVYLTNTTRFGNNNKMPQSSSSSSGRHIVYFDLYPAHYPPIWPLPHYPHAFALFLEHKLVKHFILIKLGAHIRGVAHNFVYLIFMSCAVAITRQAKLPQREGGALLSMEQRGRGSGSIFCLLLASSCHASVVWLPLLACIGPRRRLTSLSHPLPASLPSLPLLATAPARAHSRPCCA